MLQIINSTEKKSVYDWLDMYPNCKLLIKQEELFADEGYLLAVSTDSSSFDQLYAYKNSFDEGIFRVSGSYKTGGAVGVQYIVEE